MNENPLIRLNKARDAFPSATEENIFAIQREYNAALEDYRRWARDNPEPISTESPRREVEAKTFSVFDFI